MRISNTHLENIVRNHLDEKFKQELLECRSSVIDAFNKLKDNYEFSKYDDLDIDNYSEIDIMTINDTESMNYLIESIDDFTSRQLPTEIIMNCPSLKKLIVRLGGINLARFSEELCSMTIDCIDKELIYASKSTTDSIRDLFIDGRHDLIVTKSTATDIISSESRNKSIFGRKKRRVMIESLNELVDLLDTAINDLTDIIDTLRETNELFLDLTSELFLELNSNGFSKILK